MTDIQRSAIREQAEADMKSGTAITYLPSSHLISLLDIVDAACVYVDCNPEDTESLPHREYVKWAGRWAQAAEDVRAAVLEHRK